MHHTTSQTREMLTEAGLTLLEQLDDEQVVLRDEDGNLALYVRRDDYAGHVIEIDGIGYEFVTGQVEALI